MAASSKAGKGTALMFRPLATFLMLTLLWGSALTQVPRAQSAAGAAEGARALHVSASRGYGTHFQTSDRCFACHNGTTTSTGEDISIGLNWRTSMMANANRDPYWMAGVRRETIDHPAAARSIQ